MNSPFWHWVTFAFIKVTGAQRKETSVPVVSQSSQLILMEFCVMSRHVIFTSYSFSLFDQYPGETAIIRSFGWQQQHINVGRYSLTQTFTSRFLSNFVWSDISKLDSLIPVVMSFIRIQGHSWMEAKSSVVVVLQIFQFKLNLVSWCSLVCWNTSSFISKDWHSGEGTVC